MSVPRPAVLPWRQTHSPTPPSFASSRNVPGPVVRGTSFCSASGARTQISASNASPRCLAAMRKTSSAEDAPASLAAHRVELVRAELPLAGRVSLVLEPLRQAADHGRDDEHDRERDDVAEVGDAEAEERRHEEEVEAKDAENGGVDGRPVAESHRHEDDSPRGTTSRRPRAGRGQRRATRPRSRPR